MGVSAGCSGWCGDARFGGFWGANGTMGIHFACMLMSLFSLRDSVYLVWAMILELMARLGLLVL